MQLYLSIKQVCLIPLRHIYLRIGISRRQNKVHMILAKRGVGDGD